MANRCHECNIKAGAEVPKGGMTVTVSEGTCDDCGEETGIVPACDYNWPAEGKKAIFD